MKRFSASLALVGSALIVLGLVASVVRAEDSTTPDQSSDKRQSVDVKREATQTKLDDARLRACKAREAKIDEHLKRIATRGEKQLETFNKIAERTEAFYTSKGKTLSNYDALVADVNSKKAEAEKAVTVISTMSVSFKCDGGDPKGLAQAFKDQLKTEIEVLKAYKTSVRNLIVGVKSVQ